MLVQWFFSIFLQISSHFLLMMFKMEEKEF